MKLKVYAQGPEFRERTDFESLLELMNNYETTYNYCLKRSAVSHKIAVSLRPRLKLISFGPGSVDIHLITEVVAAVAPLAPQIFGYAWQLYKAGYDIISIATQQFPVRKLHKKDVKSTH